MIALTIANGNPIESPSGRSPLEFGKKFQGDLALTSDQEKLLTSSGRGGRTGVLNTYYRWPKNKLNGLVYVPYTYSAAAGFSEEFV